MSFSRRLRSGTSHAGPAKHHEHRSHNPTVAYRCEGRVQGIDDQGNFLLLVQHAHGRAKRWIDKEIEFSLRGAKLIDHTGLGLTELGLDDQVEVRTRLPRHLDDSLAYETHRVDINRMGGPDHRLLQAEAIRSGASTVRASTRK